MLLYLAGGFHFSNKLESEEKLKKELLNKFGKYNRLATFYYKNDADVIIKSVENANANKSHLKRSTKSNSCCGQ